MGQSGYAYVQMRLKENPAGTRATPTKILSAARCEHEISICTKCAGEWMTDYYVYWHRTAGGRSLQQALEMKRRAQVDEGTQIRTKADAEAYMADVLSRK